MDERLAAQLALTAVSDEEFVSSAFLLVLRRLPDEAARSTALEALRRHALSRAGLIGDLAASEEFERLLALDDGIARGLAARLTNERPHELAASANMDERPIEMAWTLGRYRGEQRVLDIGYAFAEPVWLSALTTVRPQTLMGLDLVEREVPGMSAVVGDVRRMPFRARSFDVIFCISTLEHVGADNSRYGSKKEHDPTGPLDALRELRRVVARGGRVLLTVPCGDREGDEWYASHSADEWRSLFRESDLYVYDEEEYTRNPEGWRPATDGAHGVLCAELHPGRRRHTFVRRVRRATQRR